MNNFSWFLKEIVFSKVSRKELLVSLQLSHPEFHGLDAITLSRWANNITKPSLYKQLLLAKSSDSLKEFIEKCEEPKVTHATNRVYGNFIRRLDDPYFKVLLPSNADDKVYYFNGNNFSGEPIHKSRSFRLQFDDVLNETLRKRNKSLNYEIFYTSTNKGKDATSFITFTRDVLKVFSSLSISTVDSPDVDFDKACLITLSFYKSKENYSLLTGLLLNHALEHYRSLETVFLVIRGREGMEWWEHIGAEYFSTLLISEDIGNCYIYKVDFYKVFGNPLMFKFLKDAFKLYHHRAKSDYEQGILEEKLDIGRS
ncbi:hypothetical protein [Vibrio owensii]|uniref:hypothetical protein n=1 Tax=Vibrio owensii TaxID=696485 RepID=UPI0003A0DFD2|nr:hypothetical protein [Vibrio owensii]